MTCKYEGERRTVVSRYGAQEEVVQCLRDNKYAHARDCEKCAKREEN